MNKIINANAVDGLKQLNDESVDCIITSPPYYQLRLYGEDSRELGQENTPQEFIENLMLVFKECKRVLKKDGTMFINISDTYNGTAKKDETNVGSKHTYKNFTYRKTPHNIKRKSLMGVPSRLEIALIDDGWLLRNEIIWHKPNAMPNSVKDRFNVDFEKIFFLTKNSSYYFKQIKEVMKTNDKTSPRGSKGVIGQKNSGRRKQDGLGKATYAGFNSRYTPSEDGMRNKRSVWSINTTPSELEHFAMYPIELVETMLECGARPGGVVLDPFAGSGTTLKIAKYLGYQYIGIDLYKKNCDIIEKRLKDTPVQGDLFNGEII